MLTLTIEPTTHGWKDYSAKMQPVAERLIEFWGSPQKAFNACDQFLRSEIGEGLDNQEREEQLDIMTELVKLGAKNVTALLLEIA